MARTWTFLVQGSHILIQQICENAAAMFVVRQIFSLLLFVICANNSNWLSRLTTSLTTATSKSRRSRRICSPSRTCWPSRSASSTGTCPRGGSTHLGTKIIKLFLQWPVDAVTFRRRRKIQYNLRHSAPSYCYKSAVWPDIKMKVAKFFSNVALKVGTVLLNMLNFSK